MENASKALLMAGGVLLAMLVIGILLFAWNQYSEYYSKQEDLSEIEDVTEFNLQFTNYDRKDVLGYELISLSNRVADYNFRYSNDAEAKNDERYTPITLGIELPLDKVKLNISYDDTVRVFTLGTYNQTSTNNIFGSILSTFSQEEEKYGRENLQNLSKSINSIFLDETHWIGDIYTNDYKINLKRNAIEKFNSITASRRAKDNTIKGYYESIKNFDRNNETSVNTQYNVIQNNFKEIALKYYEYTQFKKAKFESNSNLIEYDKASGRVKKMVFTFTGEIE